MHVGDVANEVVYATHLPFDPGSPALARRHTWRGVGARWSTLSLVNRHGKVTRTFTREIQQYSVEDLSLSGGASSTFGTFQAEHHLLVGSWLICLQKQRRRPVGSPLPAVVSTLELASTPRGKGGSGAVLARQIGAMPARRDRRNGPRCGEGTCGCLAEM